MNFRNSLSGKFFASLLFVLIMSVFVMLSCGSPIQNSKAVDLKNVAKRDLNQVSEIVSTGVTEDNFGDMEEYNYEDEDSSVMPDKCFDTNSSIVLKKDWNDDLIDHAKILGNFGKKLLSNESRILRKLQGRFANPQGYHLIRFVLNNAWENVIELTDNILYYVDKSANSIISRRMYFYLQDLSYNSRNILTVEEWKKGECSFFPLYFTAIGTKLSITSTNYQSDYLDEMTETLESNLERLKQTLRINRGSYVAIPKYMHHAIFCGLDCEDFDVIVSKLDEMIDKNQNWEPKAKVVNTSGADNLVPRLHGYIVERSNGCLLRLGDDKQSCDYQQRCRYRESLRNGMKGIYKNSDDIIFIIWALDERTVRVVNEETTIEAGTLQTTINGV